MHKILRFFLFQKNMDSKLNVHEWFHSHNEILENIDTGILVTSIDKIRLNFSFTFLFFFCLLKSKERNLSVLQKREKCQRVKSSVWLSLLSENNQYLENSNGEYNASVLWGAVGSEQASSYCAIQWADFQNKVNIMLAFLKDTSEWSS